MLLNLSKGVVVAEQVEIAAGFWSRFRGLMGRASLEEGSALAIKPCNSVHTCFMRFPLDVLFLNAGLQILHLEKNVVPFRFKKPVLGAVQVIELPAGTIERTRTSIGDFLRLG